ncbi:MAG: hypothetical protein HQK93_06950 [Nitrospirae bacterium]|nr:hypothetical protein [Nitrospirota bacterium]
MNLCIVEEELPAEPGVYAYNFSTKDIKELKAYEAAAAIASVVFWPEVVIYGAIGKTLFPKEFADVTKKLQVIKDIPFIKKVISKGLIPGYKIELLKIADISPNPATDKTGCLSFENAILIPNDGLKGEYNLFNDRIFCGYIKTKKHLETLLPSGKFYTIAIISKPAARRIFTNSNILCGLNIVDGENKMLYPLQSYSTSKWDQLGVNIRRCFNKLGATEILIRDKTDITAKVEIDRIAASFDANVSIKKEFDFHEKWNESSYDSQQASTFLPLLKESEHFYQTAQDLIEKPRTGKIAFKESLDVSFGLDVKVLAAFQGSFAGGYNRTIDVEITFGS